uniref:Uncharacterized protein n=1 Tax=uncultured marine virus TaxID=186617 RepID=A0A0F7L7N7_9VIRU|nr:hypothetical protein [uncultured marine virus]
MAGRFLSASESIPSHLSSSVLVSVQIPFSCERNIIYNSDPKNKVDTTHIADIYIAVSFIFSIISIFNKGGWFRWAKGCGQN